MTPTAISTDAKPSQPHGRAGSGSATATAGPDFDGVMASLGDTAGTQVPTTAEIAPALVAPRLAGDESILSMLVDKGASAGGTGNRSKNNGRDDGDAPSPAGQGQAAVPLGLMSMLIGTATPPTGSASAASEAAEALPHGVLDMKSATGKPMATKTDTPTAGETGPGEATIQSVSVTTQIAPSKAAHASQLAMASSTTVTAATGVHGASAERTSATTTKTETSPQDVANPAMTTIASIADAISDLADAAAAAPTGAAAGALSTTAPATPARTMVLQLAPADLGTVAVRLHLTGQTLDVQLSVSDPKTLGLVSRERDALAAKLDDCGYQLNALVIQGADLSTSSTAGSHDTSHNGAGADRDQSAAGGRRNASDQSGRETGRQASGDSARGDASVDGRGGLYI